MESAAPQEITWEKPTTSTICMARATGTRSTSSSSSPIRPMPPIISLLMMDTSPIGGEESAQQGVQQAAQRQQSAEQGPELIDGGHGQAQVLGDLAAHGGQDRKSTRLNSSHVRSSYAVFCLK